MDIGTIEKQQETIVTSVMVLDTTNIIIPLKVLQMKQEGKDKPMLSMPRDKVTAALHQDGAMEQVQDKVARLQKELQAAGLEESLAKATVTTNILCSDLTLKECKEGAEPVLGPTLKTEIQVKEKLWKH